MSTGYRFKNLGVTLGLAATLITLIAVSVASSQTPSDERDQKKAETIKQIAGGPDVIDPTAAALQREQYNASSAVYQSTKASFIENFPASGIDPRSLEWFEIEASFADPPMATDEAARKATLIVEGQATKVEFRPGIIGQTLVTFEISQTLKGTAKTGDEILVAFGGGPEPYHGDVNRPVMAYLGPAPLLLPGDQAVLLLTPSTKDPAHYSALPFAGVFKVDGGRITTPAGSEQEALFNNKTLNEVRRLLSAAISRNR